MPGEVGKEKIQRLELELVESRLRIETQALEAAAVATQLESAKQQVAQSSVWRKDKPDEAVVSQFPDLFKAHLQKIKAGGEFTKMLSEEEVLELKHAADMAMSTSLLFLKAPVSPEQENARMAAEDKVEEWSPPTKWALSHTDECEGLTTDGAEEVTQMDEERRKHWKDKVNPLYLSSIGLFPSNAKVAFLWTFCPLGFYGLRKGTKNSGVCASSITSSRTSRSSCSSCGCQRATHGEIRWA